MTAPRRARLTNILFVVLSLAVLPLAMGAQSTAPKPIALEDYAKFKRITGTSISPDGVPQLKKGQDPLILASPPEKK